jgi:hypothetical protein
MKCAKPRSRKKNGRRRGKFMADLLQKRNKLLNFKENKYAAAMKDETMVVLKECNSVTEAEIIKSILDSAGIWSMINNENMSAIYPTGVIPAQIVVREEDAEKAEALLSHR